MKVKPHFPKQRLAFQRRSAVTCCLLALGMCLQSILARDQWIEIQSPNFLTISNAGRGTSQDFVRQLEQFQSVVAELFGLQRITGVPLLVVIFRDDHSFTPYKFIVDGKPAPVGGFYQRGRDLDVIAVNVDRRAQNPVAIIFHEYVHRLTSYRPRSWPSWLSEGIAEFYASFELDKDQIALGVPVEHHVQFLRDQEMLPIERLIEVGTDLTEYVHSEKKGVFYAQSWALVHFLMMAEKGRYRPQLVKFTELIDLGYEARDSFYRSFDFDLSELEDRLQSYVGQNAYYVSRYRLTSSEAKKKLQTRRLGEAESLVYLADLFRNTRRKDEARASYQRAAEMGESTGRAHRGLGILHWEKQDYSMALDELSVALEQDPGDSLTTYYLMDIQLRRFESDRSPEQAAKLFATLDAVIQLHPDFARNRQLFGQLSLLAGEQLAEGVEHLQEALEIEPHDDQFRVTLVRLLMEVPDYDQAELELEVLRRSENSKVVEYAESVIQNLSQLKALLTATGTNQAVADQEPFPECNPSFVDVRGFPYLEGILRRVECGPEEVVFILLVDSQEMRFRDPQPQNPVVFSCALNVAQMSCGELGVPARIYYQDLKDAGRRALAVELKP